MLITRLRKLKSERLFQEKYNIGLRLKHTRNRVHLKKHHNGTVEFIDMVLNFVYFTRMDQNLILCIDFLT